MILFCICNPGIYGLYVGLRESGIIVSSFLPFRFFGVSGDKVSGHISPVLLGFQGDKGLG